MKDRVPLYPGRVKLTPVSGQSNVYDMVRADQPTQAGDPLNKATLLKDATAALFGLGTDAVPDDVLQKLAGAAFGSGGTITDVNGNPLGVRIATGYYVGTGTYGEDNPNSLTFELEPKLVFIGSASGNEPTAAQEYFINVVAGGYQRGNTNRNTKLTKSENSISWYNTNSAYQQLNYSGAIYHYVAIG